MCVNRAANVTYRTLSICIYYQMILPNLVCETYYTFSAKHLRDVPNFMLGARSSYLKGSAYIRCSRCASDMWNCFNIACTIHV